MPKTPWPEIATAAAVVLALGVAAVVALAAGGGEAGAPTERVVRVDRFDGRRALALVREQVRYGPRPAGSAASRRLATRLRALLPGGRFQPVPGRLRNVLGTVPGRNPKRVVVVGAHYDTKDEPGVVGANDGGSGVAVVTELARTIRPRTFGPTIVFVLFDGEESPAGATGPFLETGLRGSRVAARSLEDAEAMILLDMVGDRDLSIPREAYSNRRLWARLRTAAGRVGAGWAFPAATRGPIQDDHLPFLAAGVPAIDVIDFTFPCWHRPCDDLDTVSARSLDAVGETVLELLRSF